MSAGMQRKTQATSEGQPRQLHLQALLGQMSQVQDYTCNFIAWSMCTTSQTWKYHEITLVTEICGVSLIAD